MKWETPEGMDEYLQSTELCDSNNEHIMRKAEELAKGAEIPKEASMKVFYFVRDQIPFLFGRPDSKASDTLAKGWGFCVTKTNLQVALLRAMDIPARYRLLELSKEVLRGMMPDFLLDASEDTIWYHPWGECYLSGRWIVCEALFDRPLYSNAIEAGVLSTEDVPTIDWDGDSDLRIVTPWILEDKGAFAALDDVFRKAQREAHSPALLMRMVTYPLGNRHLNRLRHR